MRGLDVEAPLVRDSCLRSMLRRWIEIDFSRWFDNKISFQMSLIENSEIMIFHVFYDLLLAFNRVRIWDAGVLSDSEAPAQLPWVQRLLPPLHAARVRQTPAKGPADHRLWSNTLGKDG